MKKKLKIILINFLIIFFVLFLLDVSLYYRYLYMSHQYHYPYRDISYSKRISKANTVELIEKIIFEEKSYRPIQNIESNLKPILLFGCSYIQGHMLSDEQTISYKLGEHTGRPIYNRAEGGWGPQHMLFQLRSSKLQKVIKDEPEFVIYTYIPDHSNRIGVAMEPMLYGGTPTFKYMIDQQNLIYSNFDNFLFKFPLINLIRQSYWINFSSFDLKKELLKLHFTESKKEIEKLWPNAKFIVFIYESDYQILSILDDLRKTGIYAVTFQDMMNGESPRKEEWVISDSDCHPNALSWNFIVPNLILYLNNIDVNPILDKYEKKLIESERKFFLNSFERKLKLFSRDSASIFSLCNRDREILNNAENTKFRVFLAYGVWCIGNFIQDQFKFNVQNSFSKISSKLNPKNESYKIER